MNIKNLIKRKLFFILLWASTISIILIIPYIFSIQWELLKTAPVPLPILTLIIIIQNTILFAIFTFFWLILSNKINFWLPILENLLSKKDKLKNYKSIILKSIYIWLTVGISIILVNFIFVFLGTQDLFKQIDVPIRQWFLASFYWWISEEIVMRLFLMSLIILLLNKLSKSKTTQNQTIIWSSIIITSIIFGIGHLPITWAITNITPIIIARAIILNWIWWVVFGWLYWKKGLESAIIAHFSADIVIQVLFPIFAIIILN